MSYDTPWARPLPMVTDLKTALISLLEEITPRQDSSKRVSSRGSQGKVEMGVETFDVSLELLIRYLPDLQQTAQRFERSLTEVIEKMGPGLGLIRPHTRRKMQVPEIGWEEILTPPPDLQWIRTPRYPHKKAGNAKRKAGNAKQKASS